MNVYQNPRPASTAGLASCPADILYLIFGLLAPPDHRALCLVNKSLRTFAEALLYSSIEWTWTEAHEPPPITILLRTFLSRPELAAHVKNLRFDGQTLFSRGWVRSAIIPKIPLDVAGLGKAFAFIRGTGVPYADRWMEELAAPGAGMCIATIDALLALLLSQLPNLKRLYLGPNFVQDTRLIGMVLRSAICEPGEYTLPDFRHLQDISFQPRLNDSDEPSRYIKNTKDVLPFLYLPSLRRLSAGIENPVAWAWPAACLPIAPNLRTLELSCIRELYLGELLSGTQNVESLWFHWYFDWGLHYYRDRFTTNIVHLDQLGDAIAGIGSTLTDLTISAECDYASGDIMRPAIKLEGSLHALLTCENIRELQVPLAFLVGFARDPTKRLHDAMPPNVEDVFITDDLAWQNDDLWDGTLPAWEWQDYVIIDLIEKWLVDWKDGYCTPCLRRVTVLVSLTDDVLCPWLPPMQRRLTGLGVTYGLEVGFIELEEDPYMEEKTKVVRQARMRINRADSVRR
ncbi:hypothetical protein BDV10DRAFT_189212 [Aspergillus recurvatus]